MKNFFKEIKNSVYSPQFYRELLEKPFSHSLKYFAKLFLLITLIYTIVFFAFAAPFVYKFSQEAKPFIAKNFPEGLEIKIEKGIASSNQENPYFYETPATLKNKDKFKFKNLFTIDTRENIGLDEYKSYDTLVLITQDNVIYQEDQDKTTIQSLKEIGQLTINEKTVENFVKEISHYLKLLSPLLFIFVFILIYVSILVVNSSYLFFGALFIWLVAHIKKINLSYPKAYQLGLHLLTLPLIIFALPFQSFPFAFTFVLVVIAAINLEEKEEEIIPKKNLSENETNPDKK